MKKTAYSFEFFFFTMNTEYFHNQKKVNYFFDKEIREYNSWSVFKEGKVAFKRRVGLKMFG